MAEDFTNMTPEDALKAQKQNCIFCKIAKGEIPSKKVYEDENFVGVLDINPAAQGHVLIVPKEHYQIMPQMPPELVGSLGVATKKVSADLLKIGGYEGTSIFIANGFVAGQKAPHFIIHVIPRKKDDGINLNPKIIDIKEDEYAKIALKIKAGLGLSNTFSEKKLDKELDKKMDEKKESELNINDNKQETELEKNVFKPKVKLSKQVKKNINKNVKKDENFEEDNEYENNENDNDESDIDLITKMFTK